MGSLPGSTPAQGFFFNPGNIPGTPQDNRCLTPENRTRRRRESQDPEARKILRQVAQMDQLAHDIVPFAHR